MPSIELDMLGKLLSLSDYFRMAELKQQSVVYGRAMAKQ